MTDTQISDEKVIAATGKSREEWFTILDEAGAVEWSHKEMAEWLWQNHLPKGWWCQMVVVEYERARGLRQLHQRPDGYQISASKTFERPIEELYHAVEQLEHANWTTKHANKSLSGKYFDTRLEAALYPKNGKTQVVIQQSKLKTAEDADHMKKYWKEYLNALVEPSS